MRRLGLWKTMARFRRLVAPILVALLLSTLAIQVLGASLVDEGGELDVAITGIDRAAFPQMTAYVRVLGPDGLPVDDLTGGSVRVFEDGAELPASSVTLLKDDSQPVDVLLAVDVNSSSDALQAFRQAAQAFVDALGSKDRVALLAFHDTVEVAQPFTDSQADLRAAVEGLTAEGTTTALHAAIYEAAAMADARSAGHTAIVVLTDGGDEPDVPSREEAIARAQAAGVPVYVVGLGDALDELTQLAEATGGRAYAASSPAEAENGLLESLWGLRRGYQVRFQSGLEADRAPHALSVRVDHAAGSGQAEASLLAAPEAVSVTPLGIANGQVVSGVVELSAEVTAPAPVVAVEYLVNGESLGERYESPYRFAWDTRSLRPGPYTLTSKATDSAGREGLAHVNLQVVSPPLLQRGWMRYVVIALLAAAVVGAFAFSAAALFIVIHWQRTRYRRTCRVTVRNLGNVPSRYRLRAEDPSGALRFRFALDDVDLRQRQVAPVEVAAPKPSGRVAEEAAPPDEAETVREPRSRDRAARARAGRQPTRSGWKRVQEKSRWALNVGRILSDTLGAVGALLPTSMGRPLKRLATQMRQQQAAVSRVERVPRQTVSRAKRIPRKLSQIEAPPSSSAAASSASTPASSPSATPMDEEPGARTASTPASTPPSGASQTPVGVWARTPSVAPGDELALDLLVDPVKRPVEDRYCPFTVTSQAVEQEDRPPVVEEDGLQLEAVSWFRHALPFLGLGVVVLMELLVIGLVVRGLGLFG